jgi:hypothetical protein
MDEIDDISMTHIRHQSDVKLDQGPNSVFDLIKKVVCRVKPCEKVLYFSFPFSSCLGGLSNNKRYLHIKY